MSLTALPYLYDERNGDVPRRKSCRTCVRAKRRCDLAFPACSRCVQRNIKCEYPTTLQTKPDTVTLQEPMQYDPSMPLWPRDDWSQALAGPISELGMDGMNYMTTAPSASINGLPPPNVIDVDESIWSLTRTTSHQPLSARIMARIQYAINQLRDAPRMMVMENQTPWCHPLLYRKDMPSAMQDAYACCSLSLNKTPINSPVIFPLIETRVRDLLVSTAPGTATDCLARVQALILYQTIRLFDDDSAVRAAAEAHMPALDAAALSLLPHVSFEASFSPASFTVCPAADSDSSTDFWPTWIFQESARRTMLLALYLVRVFLLLKGDRSLQCDGKFGLSHSWYVSTHLWNALTRYDFAVACMEKNRFLITNADFTTVLRDAEPADVDVFGRIILSTVVGIDAANTWFWTRGATL